MKIEPFSSSITMSPGLRPSQILANNDQSRPATTRTQAQIILFGGEITYVYAHPKAPLA